MKPVLMRHCEPINESFKVWHNGSPYYHNPWHYHPECEITYIVRGSGSLFAGDQIIDYGDNELIIFGPNIPHEFRSNLNVSPDLYSESFSVHFERYFLGDTFYELPEMHLLKDILQHCARGIRVQDPATKQEVKQLIENLYYSKGFPKINLLLEMFHCLARCPDMLYLSSHSFFDSIDNGNDNRINEVYQYVFKNFTASIKVEEAASLLYMTPTSFCRFFKSRTRKQFMQYVAEVRIGYACRLLLEGKMSVAQVAYSTGFGNLSHFNKQFKTLKGMTPGEFINGYSTQV